MKILVAGVGNIFLGDDAFGVEVVRQIDHAAMPAGVKVEDFGIRGVHLSYELLEGYDALVLIDAMAMGETPGTVATFAPDLDDSSPTGSIDAHAMNPAAVLGMLSDMGGHVPRVVVIGCEPLTIDEGIGLSAPVAGAIEPAVATVFSVLSDLYSTSQKEFQP